MKKKWFNSLRKTLYGRWNLFLSDLRKKELKKLINRDDSGIKVVGFKEMYQRLTNCFYYQPKDIEPSDDEGEYIDSNLIEPTVDLPQVGDFLRAISRVPSNLFQKVYPSQKKKMD